jgi:hypothetical protein
MPGAWFRETRRTTACGRWGAKKPVLSASKRTRTVTTVWVERRVCCLSRRAGLEVAGFFGGPGALIGLVLGEELPMLPRFVPRFSYDGERGADKLQLRVPCKNSTTCMLTRGNTDEGLLRDCAIGLETERVAGPLVSHSERVRLAVGTREWRGFVPSAS